MLSIFRTKPLDQAYNVGKYQELLNKTYKEILLSEIAANTSSYSKNKVITERGNRYYTTGVRLTTVALLVSILLLFANQFIKIEKTPTKVQVINIKKSPGKNDSINGLLIVSPPAK